MWDPNKLTYIMILLTGRQIGNGAKTMIDDRWSMVGLLALVSSKAESLELSSNSLLLSESRLPAGRFSVWPSLFKQFFQPFLANSGL
jgi:hypothetical protein